MKTKKFVRLFLSCLFCVSMTWMQVGTDYSRAHAQEYMKSGAEAQGDGATLFVNTLATFAIAFVATSVLKICKMAVFKVPSAMLFMVAAGIFIGGEILAFFTYKKASSETVKFTGDGSDTQVDAAIKARDKNREAASHMERKAGIAKAAAVGFAAAGAVALIEHLMSKTSFFSENPDPTKYDLNEAKGCQWEEIEKEEIAENEIEGPPAPESIPAGEPGSSLHGPPASLAGEGSSGGGFFDAAGKWISNNPGKAAAVGAGAAAGAGVIGHALGSQNDNNQREPASVCKAEVVSYPSGNYKACKITIGGNTPFENPSLSREACENYCQNQGSIQLKKFWQKSSDEKLFESDLKYLETLHQAESIDSQASTNLAQSDSNIDAYFLFEQWRQERAGELRSPSLLHYERVKEQFTFLSHSEPEFMAELENENSHLLKQNWGQLFRSSITSMGEFLIPSSHAFFGGGLAQLAPMLGMGAGVGGAFLAFKHAGEKVKKLARAMFEKPMPRALTSAAAAALASSVAALNQKAADQLNANADEIDNMINKMNGAKSKSKKFETIQLAAANLGHARSESRQISAMCFSAGGAPGAMIPDQNCSCVQSGNCAKAVVPNLTSGQTFFKAPGSISAATQDLGRTSNSISNGDIEAALLNGNKAATQKGAIGRVTQKVQEQINKSRTSLGKKPLDFDSTTKKLTGKLTGISHSAIKSAGGAAALSGSSFAGVPSLVSYAPVKGKSRFSATTSRHSLRGGKGINPGKGGKSSDFLSLFQDKKTKQVNEASATEKKLRTFMQAQENITTNKDVPIWKIIHTRYMKSAYPTLLDTQRKPASTENSK